MQGLVSVELLKDELESLVRAGYYPSAEEAIRHALEVLLTANPTLRRSVAVDLYTQGKMTLSRAAELAGVDAETFKQHLAEAGLFIEVDEPEDEVITGAKHIRQMRSGT